MIAWRTYRMISKRRGGACVYICIYMWNMNMEHTHTQYIYVEYEYGSLKSRLHAEHLIKKSVKTPTTCHL